MRPSARLATSISWIDQIRRAQFLEGCNLRIPGARDRLHGLAGFDLLAHHDISHEAREARTPLEFLRVLLSDLDECGDRDPSGIVNAAVCRNEANATHGYAVELPVGWIGRREFYCFETNA